VDLSTTTNLSYRKQYAWLRFTGVRVGGPRVHGAPPTPSLGGGLCPPAPPPMVISRRILATRINMYTTFETSPFSKKSLKGVLSFNRITSDMAVGTQRNKQQYSLYHAKFTRSLSQLFPSEFKSFRLQTAQQPLLQIITSCHSNGGEQSHRQVLPPCESLSNAWFLGPQESIIM